MNRQRSQKVKHNPDTNDSDNNHLSGGNGLIHKITKRYSTLSSKITKRHNAGQKNISPQRVICGSYDVTGKNSEDHRLEIGAPVLISTTTLDSDRFDVSDARLRQIGGGIAMTSTMVRTITTIQSSPQIPSSGSENEVFVDALSTTPIVDEQEQCEEKFILAMPTPLQRLSTSVTSPESPEESYAALEAAQVNPLTNYYAMEKRTRTKGKFNRKLHSKSAQNLHRTEMKVYLQKAPSVEFNSYSIEPGVEYYYDLPKLPELYSGSHCIIAASSNDQHEDKENSPTVMKVLQSKSDPNTPLCPEQKVTGYLSQQQRFSSVDSLDNCRSAVFSSKMSVNEQGSKNSLASHNSSIGDFDLKSVSCQSLNAQNLFVSIDELNEITRQINESEDFNREIDLEYCMHRDNLKPNERRITLLKNKNSRLISFNNNKEKLKKSWTGMKHWIGEESSKLKDAMQKQTTGQKQSGSKLNLSSHFGSNASADLSKNFVPDNNVNSSPPGDVCQMEVSCDNIAVAGNEIDDIESSFTHRPGDDSPASTMRLMLEGQNGFEELRRYIKQGGDFSKELILILQERVDSELLYSKSLSKMANKLNKTCRELPGSIAEAWRGVATEMESRSDVHRQLSISLTDEIVKPLKTIVDSQHKTRKSVENSVDKASRVLAEWRISEAKSKKASHTAARENEKLQDAMLDVRIQKSPSIALLHQGPNKVTAEKEIKSAEKDCAKLDSKRKKAEEAVKRADVEYYTLCVRAERARVDWEMAVLRGSSLLQSIENKRLLNMKNFVSNYMQLTANMNPILDSLLQRLLPQVDACNVLKDLQVVKNIRRNSEGPSEQLLPDFYCEHTTLAMNRERRKHSLIKLLQLVKADLERERRSRNGLKGLSQSLNNQENQNITDKLYHIRSMLTYLEGSRFKLHSALLELDHKPRTSHPLAQHIQITRDRTGLQQSILKVPLWLKNNDRLNVNSGEESIGDNDYDSTANTSTNISCTDISKDLFMKSFSRSKSNVETISSNSKNCVNRIDKAKTIPVVNPNAAYCDRGQADGGSNQQDSDFDEFSSPDDDDDKEQTCDLTVGPGRKEPKVITEKSTDSTRSTKPNSTASNSPSCSIDQYQHTEEINDASALSHIDINDSATSSNCSTTVVLSKCKALYSYTPKLYDELQLSPGDIIEVHAKQEDGWWLGALGNQVGIFPATYVEDFVE